MEPKTDEMDSAVVTSTHRIEGFELLMQCPPDIRWEDWENYLDELQEAEYLSENANPVQIDLELNSGCNMKCPFCSHGYEDIQNENMPDKTVYSLINDAVRIGVKSIKFNYINEPMLRKDLENIIAYAKAAGIINTYLATNGTLLTEKRRASMLASGITKIFVSIDAATEGSYNEQRLSGKFDQVVENVMALIRERDALGQEFPIIRVSFLENMLNYHESEDFYEFWNGIADVITFQKMDEVPNHTTGLIATDKNQELFTEPRACEFPFKQIVVSASGELYPCCKMQGKNIPLGNINTVSLLDAWNGQTMRDLRELHRQQRWDENPACKKCMGEP